MHNNFYFLRQLTKHLDPILTGSVVSECFSQSKDELVLRFETQGEPFVMRASLLPELSCLSFPHDFQRARKNSVDLFPEIAGRRVTGLHQFDNERSFAINFSDDFSLLFKMHGNRTNLLLCRNMRVIDLFRNKLTADLTLDPTQLDRSIDWSYEYFLQHANNLRAAYFTFGKVVWEYLDRKGFFDKRPQQQWEMIGSIRRDLENPTFYIIRLSDKPVLSLLDIGETLQRLPDPIKAANAYYHAFIHDYALVREKATLMSALTSRLNSARSYCDKNAVRLSEIKHQDHYRIWADLIMANMHVIPAGAETITVPNFYADNHPTQIKLKKELSPQKNAEAFYRKAKNQHIEIERLEDAIAHKRLEMEQIEEMLVKITSTDDLKALRSLKADMPSGDEKKEAQSLPYHEYIFKGYRIWIGKNAAANDKLTLKHGYKEDLWLHAKDVSGSHVLIKYQSGKNFPKDVIEYAASLAAFYSKRKNESLCPVIVTPRKFVRKRKGDPAGAVVIEREQVIMVTPHAGG